MLFRIVKLLCILEGCIVKSYVDIALLYPSVILCTECVYCSMFRLW